MSRAYPSADREYDPAPDEDREDDDRNPALTPLVIDVIPDQTRAELEESIDAPLVVERFEQGRDSESGSDAASNVGGNYD